MTIIDVAKFEYDFCLGNEIEFYIIIKGFNQEKIVQKIIERNGNRGFGLTYLDNTDKRTYSKGLISRLALIKDTLTLDDIKNSEFIIECLEPFSIAQYENNISYNSGTQIILADKNNENIKTIKNDWLSYIHTIEFSPDGKKLLVSSAGYDTVMEFNIENEKLLWEWNLWDLGFNFSNNTNSYVIRKKELLEYFQLLNKECLLIETKDWPNEGLPTYKCPNRLNGVSYDSDSYLISCFHKSELLLLNKNGFLKVVSIGLSHPHNFRKIKFHDFNGYFVTDSGNGKVILLDTELSIKMVYDFSNLPCEQDKKFGFGEWLQTSSITESPSLLVVVDSLRNGIHIIDSINKKRRFISTPNNWTVQMVMCVK